jgi:hypothetical protein
MFAKAIAQLYDLIIQTELPASLHIRYLLERKNPQLRKERRNNASRTPESKTLTEHANECAFAKNIHSSFHTDSCINWYLPYFRFDVIAILPYWCHLFFHVFYRTCRYCKGSVLAPVTGGRLITPHDHGPDTIRATHSTPAQSQNRNCSTKTNIAPQFLPLIAGQFHLKYVDGPSCFTTTTAFLMMRSMTLTCLNAWIQTFSKIWILN